MLSSPLGRLTVIAFLFVGLMIPLTMTWGLVTERASRRDAVAAEIGTMWGGAQRLSGPSLTIPYRCAPRERAASAGTGLRGGAGGSELEDEQGAADVQQDVRQMESEWIQSPDLPVDAVGQEGHRPVVLEEFELEIGKRVCEAVVGLETREDEKIVS